MPIEPSVFHPIRKNDVQQKTLKAYKKYKITNVGFTTESGYVRQNAVYLGYPEPVGTDIQDSLIFPGINEDGTHKTVVWSTADHRFYRHPYDPARTQEHFDEDTVEKKLWWSASLLTAPYFEVGEKIKPGSVTASFTLGSTKYDLKDDGFGNLRDRYVLSESFASQSKSVLHLSFNETFRQFKDADKRLGVYKDGLKYKVGEAVRFATPSRVAADRYGVVTTGSFHKPSGMAGHFVSRSSYIRIAHTKEFNRFNCCDDWTICFWIRKATNDQDTRHIFSKGGVIEEDFLDEVTYRERKENLKIQVHGPGHGHHGKGRKNPVKPQVLFEEKSKKILRKRDRNIPLPDVLSSYKKHRVPFMIGVQTFKDTTLTKYHFRSSDGSNELYITASSYTLSGSHEPQAWDHVLLRNTGSICQFFINGVATGQSGSLPRQPVVNECDLMIGNPNTIINFLPNAIKRLTLQPEPINQYEVSGDLVVWGSLVVLSGVLLIIRGDLIVRSGGSVTIEGGNDEYGPATVKIFGNTQEYIGGSIIEEEGATVVVTGGTEDENDYSLSELRMYDYGVNQTAIDSLCDRGYETGSLYQTNVAGNVFYKNAQVVVTSPMPKYNTGSCQFGTPDTNEQFELEYRGVHTIYENEVLVRVPRDFCNVPMNPTANYTPNTGDACLDDEEGTLPGEFRKKMFVSGTALPFVTTVGLYDDEGRLLAIGKTGQAIQKREDLDMNFVVRWDY